MVRINVNHARHSLKTKVLEISGKRYRHYLCAVCAKGNLWLRPRAREAEQCIAPVLRLMVREEAWCSPVVR